MFILNVKGLGNMLTVTQTNWSKTEISNSFSCRQHVALCMVTFSYSSLLMQMFSF